MAGVEQRAASLSRVRAYLRRKGIANIHRFLLPLRINDEINRALARWSVRFTRASRV